MQKLLPIIFAALLALLALSLTVFTVDQRHFALVFQLGQVIRVVSEPGVQVKAPFLQSVRYFDRRIQTIDAEMPARFNTIEKMNVKVDSYVKWRIVDVERYYKAVGNDPRKAVDRLRNTVNNMLRDEFGKKTVQDVISGKREEVMAIVRAAADTDAQRIGVRIVDVRLKRVDFEDSTSNSVYDRMQSERKAVASQQRAEGVGEAEKIKADADKQREIVLAEAYNKAQQMKGEGDAKAAAISSAAYGQNPEFYAFYKSMDAYRNSFGKKGDVLVLEPNSEFFKYMKNSKAGK